MSSNSNFTRGPEKIMLLPNKKESYKFDIVPTQRGSYKGAITFRPGEWPIKLKQFKINFQHLFKINRN